MCYKIFLLTPSECFIGGIIAFSWYLKGRTERVLYCQPIPGGKLASDIKKAVNSVAKNGTLIVEDGSTPKIAYIKRSDPFRKEEYRYGDESCIVENNKDCTQMGVIYLITYNQCKEPVNLDVEADPMSRDPGQQNRYNYIGMTQTSEHCRMLSHL